jgi:hypothetical protein
MFSRLLYGKAEGIDVTPEYHAHYSCFWCDTLRPKTEIVWVDDKPICSVSDCKDEYYKATKPQSVPKSLARFEHG